MIEVKNKVHTFVVGDRSHPQTEEIYAELQWLTGLMKEAGDVPDVHFMLHDKKQEQVVVIITWCAIGVVGICIVLQEEEAYILFVLFSKL